MSFVRQDRIRVALLAKENCPFIGKLYDEPRLKRIERSAQLLRVVLTPKNLPEYREEAAQTQVLFTTWDIPTELLTPGLFPSLKVILHTAGSVKSFAGPLLKRGVMVTSARSANATPVAHFCLGQIILSCKGYFRNTQMCRNASTMLSYTWFAGSGAYGEKIALLGMGAVGRELTRLLRNFDFEILAVDPYLSASAAAELGVKLVSTEAAFAEAYVVSNHLPDLPELKQVLNGPLFRSMRRDATFINTGRGAQVNEADLIETAQQRPDLMFLLDVTKPEPPQLGSPLYELPNVQLSSHIAGATNDEVRRLSDAMIEELERYVAGQPLAHAVSLEMLDRLA